MEPIRTEEYKGYTIKIFPEEMADNPREWDNLGTMVCFHNRYSLGDKHDLIKENFNSWDEVAAHLIKEQGAFILLPLYLYDHSGISMSTILTYPYNDRWDSGQVGIIYITRDKIRQEYGVKHVSQKLADKVKQYLVNEVKTYDQYLRGDVICFVIEDADGESIDSCGGIYDSIEEVIKNCKSTVDGEIAWANKHYPKVEVFVTRTNKFRARIRESVEQPSYEVTIGGDEWQKGKGKAHEKTILDKIATITGTLVLEERQTHITE